MAAPVDILQIGPYPEWDQGPLDTAFAIHRYFEADDKAELLARVGPRIRGIATRGFERRFHIADHVEVVGASLKNGLLHIDLKREIPEEMKPRKIAIASAGSKKAQQIEAKAA